ncbi:MAG: hypothetical protein A2X86_09510 [Bdellovibrionales bacterium GWA2_49_15]|nr:MAG: hypothetical protein A2X86_09510 [Bdellovibrionales bacterium GWA2_49_15]HAZ13016.1 hypothetical protein [Bdellovibrionales bacterium]
MYRELWAALLLIIFPTLAFAEDGRLATMQYLEHPLTATYDMLNVIAGDTTAPLTDANGHDWKMSVKPTYFKVDKLFYTDQGSGGGADYKGDNLEGYALSMAYAKSITDRWQFYTMINALKNKGRANGRVPGQDSNGNISVLTADNIILEGTNSVANMSFGFGFDTIETPVKWTIPIFFGVFVQRYKTDLTATSLTSFFPSATVKGEGFQYGVSMGVQFKRKLFENFFIAPYFFAGIPFAGPKLEATITDTKGNFDFVVGHKETAKLSAIPFATPGLSLGYTPWGLSFNALGPAYSIYSAELFNGLKMSTYSLTMTFGNSQ